MEALGVAEAHKEMMLNQRLGSHNNIIKLTL
jgi:hypothetical protein